MFMNCSTGHKIVDESFLDLKKKSSTEQNKFDKHVQMNFVHLKLVHAKKFSRNFVPMNCSNDLFIKKRSIGHENSGSYPNTTSNTS